MQEHHVNRTERAREHQESSNPRYVRIDLDARALLDLSVTEYALLGVIDVLSRKTGWCFASREYLARVLGISSRSVRRMLVLLRERDLVEGNRSLRPSARFREALRPFGKDTLSGISGQIGR